MKNKNVYALLLLSAMCSIMACNKDAAVTTDQPGVYLYTCQNVKDLPGVRICFDSLIADSRCPEDVVCIWAGYAEIKVSFHENGNVHSFNMYLPGGPKNDTTINGYKLKFVDLLPHTKVSEPFPTAAERKAVFEIAH